MATPYLNSDEFIKGSGKGKTLNISVFVVEKNPLYVFCMSCVWFGEFSQFIMIIIVRVVVWIGRFVLIASVSSLIKCCVYQKPQYVLLCLYCVFTFNVSGVLKYLST